MSNVKLDLSKFKHVSSDGKTTKLRHVDGHFLVLAHGKLGKDGQDQLQALAKGGGVSEQGKDVRHANKTDKSMHYAKEEAKGRAQMERTVKPNIKGLAEGGKIPPEKAPEKPKKLEDSYDKSTYELAKETAGDVGRAIKHIPENSKLIYDAMLHKAEGGKVQVPAEPKVNQPNPTEKPVGNEYHGAKEALGRLKKEFMPSYAEGSGDVQADDGFTFGNQDSKGQEAPPKFGKANLKSQEEYQAQIHRPDTGSEDYSNEANPPNAQQAIRDHIDRTITSALSVGKQVPQNQSAQPQEQGPAPQAPGQMAPQAPMQQAQAAPMPQDQASAQPEPMGANAQEQATQPEEMAAQAPQAAPAMAAQPNPNQMPMQSATPAPVDPNSPEAIKQHFAAEDQAWQHDLNNGHITPETYQSMFAKKDTLGKVSSIFGLLLGGIGSGLIGQPNAALQMMDKAIQNDLDAQKQSKDNARNFVQLNHQILLQQAQAEAARAGVQLTKEQAAQVKQQTAVAADALSNIQMNRATLHDLAENVAKMSDTNPNKPKAQQLLALAASSVDAKSMRIQDMAASQIAWLRKNSGGANPEQAYQDNQQMLRASGNPALIARADQNDERHLPSGTGMVGQASTPLNAATRETISSGAAFDKQLAHFIDWSKKHSGDLDPRDREYGQAMAAELQGAYRAATNGGVYKEGEQNFIGKLIHETPTVFFNKIRVLPSLKALQDTNQAKMNQIARNNGFDGYDRRQVLGESSEKPQGITPEQQKMIDRAKKNPNNPAAQKILRHFGQQ